MVNPFVTKPPRRTGGESSLDQRCDVASATLTDLWLGAVAGGLNPQPLPPCHEEFELR